MANQLPNGLKSGDVALYDRNGELSAVQILTVVTASLTQRVNVEYWDLTCRIIGVANSSWFTPVTDAVPMLDEQIKRLEKVREALTYYSKT